MSPELCLFLAAGLSLVTFLVHLFAGGVHVARPLLASTALPPASKWLNYYCWHLVTLMLGFMALGFFWLGTAPYMPGIVFLTLLAVSSSMLSLFVGLKAAINPFRFPSTSLFAVIAVSGGAAILMAA
ncbi:hypothetical protein [Hyphomonas sp.]|uniref:hypothetical protein n=1 Tax=Hyphomonas sp. TaxID=87 RepID=UPI0025C7075A|nr:hypothetical protein [Hyphomonas sp.]